MLYSICDNSAVKRSWYTVFVNIFGDEEMVQVNSTTAIFGQNVIKRHLAVSSKKIIM